MNGGQKLMGMIAALNDIDEENLITQKELWTETYYVDSYVIALV